MGSSPRKRGPSGVRAKTLGSPLSRGRRCPDRTSRNFVTIIERSISVLLRLAHDIRGRPKADHEIPGDVAGMNDVERPPKRPRLRLLTLRNPVAIFFYSPICINMPCRRA